MKKALTILLLICFAFFAKAQSDDSGNALYPNNFNIISPAVVNNTVVIPPSYIKGSFGITVSGMYKPYFSDIKTSVVVVSSSGEILASVDGPSFNRSDFTIGGVVYNNSTYKDFTLSLPLHSTLGYSKYKNSQVIVRYKYYFNPAVGIPNQETAGWAPQVTFNREWFIHDKKYKITLADPETSINGPNAICDEANYSIVNPGTVTLENADGIAALTQLSNSQWKIKRIGTASGFVKLRSTYNGKTFDKEIEIGTIAKGAISGDASLPLGESRTYTLALNGNTDYNWSVSYNPNVTWTKLSPTSIKLSTTGSVPQGWSENITISAQAISSCGLSSNYITKTIKFVNDRDPRLED
ncbi:hypothetical protein [Sphingobacterium ginsenosidimutans]|jgi:hypothetical protein|uniref:Uncharacterized protein n=1 Tax=Sphingobacterium ginsenosidimutans TaxID=687845 RepID=A0ABP8A640_9SPHI